jgi:hypothetical protein
MDDLPGRSPWAVLVALAGCVLGCSSSSAGASSHGPYPAFDVPLPQILDSGGPTLAQPRLTSITFSGDARADQFDAFISALPTLTSWTDVLTQYGVSSPTATAPFHVPTAAPATVNESTKGGPSDVQSFLASMLDGTHASFPAADPDAIYVIFYPPGTSITMDGQLFSQAGGYHLFFDLHGVSISYAVVPALGSSFTFPNGATLSTLDGATGIASHEIAEAATDPQTLTSPAWSNVDPKFGVCWGNAVDSFSTEIGDMCAGSSDAFVAPDGFGFTVQRIWSNAAAAGHHNPCQPRDAADVYPVAMPQAADTLTTNAGTVTGITLHAGVSRTIPVELASDAPTTSPWQVSAGALKGTDTATFAPSGGQNGDVLEMTVSLGSLSSPFCFGLTSTLGATQYNWPTLLQVVP